ncbi:hypothetical protein BGZ80_008273, partial [Entomortierella chlamydospora]
CDETEIYLKELNTGSYTAPGETNGFKAKRKRRASVLLCVNASALSLPMADTMDDLKHLFIDTIID